MNSPFERSPASPGFARSGWVTLALIVAVIFGLGLFFASAHGFSGLYLWTVMFAFGTGLALALFWERRRAAWYWPTATLLVVTHIILLCMFKWQLFSRPSTQFGSGPMFKGAIGIDFTANTLCLYVVKGFLDSSSATKTRPMAVAKAIKLGFALLALVTPIVIALLVVETHRKSG